MMLDCTDLEADVKKAEGSGYLKKTCLSTELVETKLRTEVASESFFKSGADTFRFSDPHVLRLIQGASNSKFTLKSTRPQSHRTGIVLMAVSMSDLGSQTDTYADMK
nr:histone-lysine N-methyltransferase ATX2-like isoform X1 [Tanacetum cinerariifolium]